MAGGGETSNANPASKTCSDFKINARFGFSMTNSIFSHYAIFQILGLKSTARPNVQGAVHASSIGRL